MIQQAITISNRLGLHARASAKLTKLAGSFPCEVWVTRGSRRGIGTEITLETNGEREEEAMQALVDLINDKFGEGE